MTNINKKRIRVATFMRKLSAQTTRTLAYRKKWLNYANKIEMFENHIGEKLFTNSFTPQITESYIYFLKTQIRAYAPDTLIGYWRSVGESVRKAEKEGYVVNHGYEGSCPHKEEATSVYLNKEEIGRIFNLQKLSREAHAVRERFVIACCTGMRIGDIKSLTLDNFQGNNVIRKTQKTGATVIIPQHWMVKEIIKRNKGELPTLRSIQAYNTMVKRLCRKAGITEKILVEKTRGIKVIRKLIPKWQLVSSHTARRSLATNMYLDGIPAVRIMLITGHTTEQSFFKYIRINKSENAKELANHSFFTG